MFSSFRDANKKLHDTNDDLRAAIEAAKGSKKRSYLVKKITLVSLRFRFNPKCVFRLIFSSAYTFVFCHLLFTTMQRIKC